MADKLCYISATEAIEKFKDGELSPVTLIQAIIERAEAVAAFANVFAHTYFGEAMGRENSVSLRKAVCLFYVR